MPTVTAYIIAYNEADKVRAAVESVLWADEIIVADSHSTDDTASIAESLGAKVVQIDFEGFGKLRNSALEHCTSDWVFSLDSDERCTPALRDEIRAITSRDDGPDIYRVPRRNFFMGRWIKHSGWYPNYRQPQLFRRGAMRYTEEPVHEGFEALSSKPLAACSAHVWQVPFKDLDECIAKMNRYSTLGVDKIEHKSGSMLSAVIHGVHAFVKHYVFKLGVLDGWAGLVIAVGYFEQTFYRYAKLHWRNGTGRGPRPNAWSDLHTIVGPPLGHLRVQKRKRGLPASLSLFR